MRLLFKVLLAVFLIAIFGLFIYDIYLAETLKNEMQNTYARMTETNVRMHKDLEKDFMDAFKESSAPDANLEVKHKTVMLEALVEENRILGEILHYMWGDYNKVISEFALPRDFQYRVIGHILALTYVMFLFAVDTSYLFSRMNSEYYIKEEFDPTKPPRKVVRVPSPSDQHMQVFVSKADIVITRSWSSYEKKCKENIWKFNRYLFENLPVFYPITHPFFSLRVREEACSVLERYFNYLKNRYKEAPANSWKKVMYATKLLVVDSTMADKPIFVIGSSGE